MAPRDGLEPPTQWLTATCSTAELPGKSLKYIVLKVQNQDMLTNNYNI